MFEVLIALSKLEMASSYFLRFTRQSPFKEAAALAKEAQVKEMWLTHYSPSLVRPEEALPEAQKIFPNTIAARDRQSVELQFEEE